MENFFRKSNFVLDIIICVFVAIQVIVNKKVEFDFMSGLCLSLIFLCDALDKIK